MAPPPPMPIASTSTPTTHRARTVKPRAVALFLLVVVALPVVTATLAIDRFPQLSALDEYAHIDYLRRVESGSVPRIGEQVVPETRRDVACRTIAGRPVADCQAESIPADAMDADGYSYEAQQPPLYYAVTAAIRQPFRLVTNGYVNAARLTGVVWLGLGLAMLWWFLRRRLSAGPVAAALACALVALAPYAVAQASTVNNDAAAILIGASVLVGFDRLRHDRRWRTSVLAAVGAVLLVLIKPLAVLPIGVVTLALLLDPGVRPRRVRAAGLLLLPAALGGLTYQVWQEVRDARAVAPYETVVDALLRTRPIAEDFPIETVGRVSPRFLEGYGEAIGTLAAEPFVHGVATTVGLVFVYAPSIATALGRGRRDLQHLHVALLVVALAAPPLLVAQSYFEVQRDGGANPRYALALLPIFVTALVPWLQERWTRRFATLGVVVLLAVTLIGLATHEVV